ncbi:MAG: hypothetical protein KDK25_00320 [Leptospiraceae bacterium]|nr:hypothetical protein [Leptospiraceae bacterium]
MSIFAIGSLAFLLSGSLFHCKTPGQYCDNAWLDYYPSDLEFQEELTTATLRSGRCYSQARPSTIVNIHSLDGVDPASDLVLPMNCGADEAIFLKSYEAGQGPVRMLNLSKGEAVRIRWKFIRSSAGCGLVVRPVPSLEYDSFYGLYLMRGRQTERAFDEPRVFQKLKWKAHRNNIETEADELYRDALLQATERWSSHPESFLMILAFTTRSFRGLTIPSLAVRNLYFARNPEVPRLLESLEEAHPLASFMLEYSRILLDGDFAASLQSANLSPDQGIPRSPQVANLLRLGQALSLRTGFVEIPGSCITDTEPERCHFVEVELRNTNLRYIPLLYSPAIKNSKRVMIIPLDTLSPGRALQRLREWKQKLEPRGIGILVLASPLPTGAMSPDHVQALLLHSAISLDALISSHQEVALLCNESQYCPMVGLYSRPVAKIVIPGGLEDSRPGLEFSFPVEQYRARQLELATQRPFQFPSYLTEMDKTLHALRKKNLDLVNPRDLEWLKD